ncbi:MAG: hypothetical protein R3F34_08355 [Planctomycetota bacterium]
MMLSTALAWAILWPGASPVVPVALPQPLVVPATCAVAPVGDEAEELVELLRLRGNRISVDDLTRLAKIGSPEALAGFELALDGGVLTSEVARARALRATAYFMKSRDVAGKVREKLANWAANAPNSLEGIAAVETLAAGGGIAKEWLQRIVESPAVTAVRVRAFELHRESFEMKEDRDWYYQLWQKYDAASRAGSSAPEDPSVGKPLGTVAGLAFEAIAPKLEEEMLRRALSDQNSRVRTAAMAELADRGDKSIVSQARATFLNTQYGATERAQCAAVLARRRSGRTSSPGRALAPDGRRARPGVAEGRRGGHRIRARLRRTHVRAAGRLLRDRRVLGVRRLRARCARDVRARRLAQRGEGRREGAAQRHRRRGPRGARRGPARARAARHGGARKLPRHTAQEGRHRVREGHPGRTRHRAVRRRPELGRRAREDGVGRTVADEERRAHVPRARRRRVRAGSPTRRSTPRLPGAPSARRSRRFATSARRRRRRS